MLIIIISVIVCRKWSIVSKCSEEENENLECQERLKTFLECFERKIIPNKLFHFMTVSGISRKIFHQYINAL